MKKIVINASQRILQGILHAGIITLAVSTSSYSTKALTRALNYSVSEWRINKDKRKYLNSFTYLRKYNLIKYKYRGKQLYISITKKGEKLVERYNINKLRIKKPRKWDGKWRVVVFDISTKQKTKREALRGKLKEFGFYQLQKSVWTYPYKCDREIDILRNFFLLDKSELTMIVAMKIKRDNQTAQRWRIHMPAPATR